MSRFDNMTPLEEARTKVRELGALVRNGYPGYETNLRAWTKALEWEEQEAALAARRARMGAAIRLRLTALPQP